MTIVYHPSVPILIADNDGNNREASAGAAKLFGLPREKIVGRPLVEFSQPRFKPQLSLLWQAFLQQGEQDGILRLAVADGKHRDVEYTAKLNILPVRHVLTLRDKSASAATEESGSARIPSWVRDYALYLIDAEGIIVAWYGGAVRIFGYAADEAIGQKVTILYADENNPRARLQ